MKNYIIYLLSTVAFMLFGCANEEHPIDENQMENKSVLPQTRTLPMDISTIQNDYFMERNTIKITFWEAYAQSYPNIYYRKSINQLGEWKYFASKSDLLSQEHDGSFTIERYDASKLEDNTTYEFKFENPYYEEYRYYYNFPYEIIRPVPEELQGYAEMRKVKVTVIVSSAIRRPVKVNILIKDNSISEEICNMYGAKNLYAEEFRIESAGPPYIDSAPCIAICYLCCYPYALYPSGIVSATCLSSSAYPTYYSEDVYFSSDPSTREIVIYF